MLRGAYHLIVQILLSSLAGFVRRSVRSKVGHPEPQHRRVSARCMTVSYLCEGGKVA